MMDFINEEECEFIRLMKGLNGLEQSGNLNGVQRKVTGNIGEVGQKLFENDSFSRAAWSHKANVVFTGVIENTLKHKPCARVRFPLRYGCFIQLENCCAVQGMSIRYRYILVNRLP